MWYSFIGVVGLCFLVAGCTPKKKESPANPSPQELRVVLGQATVLKLGEVEANSRTTFSLVLVNGDTQASEFAVNTSCECTKVVPSRMRIEAGAEARVALVIDLKHEKDFHGGLMLMIGSEGNHPGAKSALKIEADLKVR